MFNVFVLSFKTFISSVYSVTGIAMPLSILGISWSFISSIYCVCVCVYIYIYINKYNKYRFRHRLGTGTVLKVSIWHRYRKKTKQYPTLLWSLTDEVFPLVWSVGDLQLWHSEQRRVFEMWDPIEHWHQISAKHSKSKWPSEIHV